MESQARRLIHPHRKQWGILRFLRKISELAQNPSPDAIDKLNRYCQRIAGDVNAFSKEVEEVNIRLENAISDMTENVLGFIDWAASNQQIDPEEVAIFREQIGILGREAKEAGDTYRSVRDSSQGLGNQDFSIALTSAWRRNAKAINGLVLNIEEVENFSLKAQFLIDEKFGKA
ncbi:MAG: hypothetical protein H0W99_01220 [Acidobacteria bacterium]|nr:hypothetical protein [Acidobacteriota bacterium]